MSFQNMVFSRYMPIYVIIGSHGSSIFSFLRDLFIKTRDTKVKFHAKIDSKKDRNGMNLTEAEDIKKWQEYTNCTEKIFMTQIITTV